MTREEIIAAVAAGKPLSGADLSGADLRSADLSGADLRSADLHRADLRSADLHSADLRSADLRSADLRSAYLHSADLRSASLRCASLGSADLRGADLRGADLRGTNLRGTNLSGANLSGANLSGAITDEKTRWPAFQIPQEGTLIVYKKATGHVLKLQVPAKAKRTASLIGRKCRAEYVKVLAGAPKPVKGDYDKKTVYCDGKITRADKWDSDPKVECAPGIHFFLTKAEAEAY